MLPTWVLLSDTFINYLDTGTEHVLSKCADDTQLEGMA